MKQGLFRSVHLLRTLGHDALRGTPAAAGSTIGSFAGDIVTPWSASASHYDAVLTTSPQASPWRLQPMS